MILALYLFLPFKPSCNFSSLPLFLPLLVASHLHLLQPPPPIISPPSSSPILSSLSIHLSPNYPRILRLPFLPIPIFSLALSTSVTGGGHNLSVSPRAKSDQGKQSGVCWDLWDPSTYRGRFYSPEWSLGCPLTLKMLQDGCYCTF